MSWRHSRLWYWWRDMQDFVVFATPVVLVLVAIFAAIVVPIMLMDRYSCNQKLDRLGLEGDWGLWTGCVVDLPGGSIPLDQYFVNNPEDS